VHTLEKNTLFMRKISTPVTTAMVSAIALLSASCQKDVETDKAVAVDSYKGYEQKNYKPCEISQITVHVTDGQGPASVVYTFNYNAAGDPVTVRNTAVGTGNPNAVFKYNQQGKLKEMIRPYDNGTFETWTKYIYNNGGQIVRDTQYTFGSYVDSIPSAQPEMDGYWVSRFTYDQQGRVMTRIDSVFGPGTSVSGTTYNFQYDAHGNLVVQGVAYDSRQSLLRTNKIWMFVCNNFSQSNAFQASAYNKSDLPLSFPGTYGTMGPIVPLDGTFDIVYACSITNGRNGNGQGQDNNP
jgi:YD repeat-containing protein